VKYAYVHRRHIAFEALVVDIPSFQIDFGWRYGFEICFIAQKPSKRSACRWVFDNQNDSLVLQAFGAESRGDWNEAEARMLVDGAT